MCNLIASEVTWIAPQSEFDKMKHEVGELLFLIEITNSRGCL